MRAGITAASASLLLGRKSHEQTKENSLSYLWAAIWHSILGEVALPPYDAASAPVFCTAEY